ncbi:uncharacterized protein [Euwallacea similis]|uniref:uncharacterized protein isoform X1 n=1 Tax=Euwallacea similis TaxID=1736056 RepID=UPI00344EB0E1
MNKKIYLRNNFTRIMARQYRVLVNYMQRGAYEADLKVMEDNESGIFLQISPGPNVSFSMSVPIADIDNVINLNRTTIRLELELIGQGHHIDIEFGTELTKNAFRRLIRADSDDDSGRSSGTPSPNSPV